MIGLAVSPPAAAAAYLLIVNLLGFLLFGADKKKARKKQWRIPEKYLFLTALMGGWAGCIAGMYAFRHKTRHRSFTFGLPLIGLAEVILFFLLLR